MTLKTALSLSLASLAAGAFIATSPWTSLAQAQQTPAQKASTRKANDRKAESRKADIADPHDTRIIGPAHVDLRVNVGEPSNEQYEPRTSIQIPASHTIGDQIFPYEGIGWENELIGYRLYLDERAVTDVFGKKTPKISLPMVDYRSKYHEAAPWGQDVMHVGPSMGVGGLGLYRGESLERFGNQGQLFVEIIKRSGPDVAFKIKHRAVPVAEGVTGDVDTIYSMKAGSALTMVDVKSTMPPNTLATGLVMAPGLKRLRNTDEVTAGGWRYLAVWGNKRSEAKDGLGTVVFFRQGDAQQTPVTNETFPIRFTRRAFTYAFGAVWEQGPQGIKDEASFIAWVEEQRKTLPAKPPVAAKPRPARPDE